MKKNAIAKISRPNAASLIHRKRLFRLLDNARKQPALWVAGPAGSGKTSLIASYLDARGLPCLWYDVDAGDADIASFFYYLGLAAQKAAPRCRKPLPLFTPEYLHGLATFARRYFETLYSRLKSPFVIVLDNFQEAAEESLLHGILLDSLAQAPPGIQVMVLSRNEPPSAFTRLRAHGAIGLIGWEELRFTPAESKRLILMKEKRTLPADVISMLCERTEGWAAGLVLLAEGEGTCFPGRRHADAAHGQEVFDYFAGEVFEKLDAPTRDFLLLSSLLPQMNVRSVMKLTGNEDGSRIFAALSRNHFFTQEHGGAEPTYRFHALFREFLLTRLRESCSPGEFLQVQKQAAALLEESGRVEHAIQLFSEARDWGSVTRMVLSHAQELISQGRRGSLRAWLDRIPPEDRKNHPWLLYWTAVCTLPVNPAEGRAFFERAFQLFGSRQDEAGVLLAWSGAVQTFLFEFDDFRPLDRWIAWLDQRAKKVAAFPAPEIKSSVAAGMTGALTWRMPAHRHLHKWVGDAVALSNGSANVEASMRAYTNSAVYYIWMGLFDECGLLIGKMKKMVASRPVSPLRRILVKNTEAMFYNTSAVFGPRALQAVTEGLGEARETGVHVVDPLLCVQGAISSLNQGDRDRTKEFLAKLEGALRRGSRTHTSHYYYLTACYCLLTEDLLQAVLCSKKSADLAEEAGVPISEALARLMWSLAAQAMDNHREAAKALAKAKQVMSRTGSSYIEYLFLLTESYFSFARKRQRAGLEALRRALALGRQRGYSTLLYFWRPAVMSRLCAEALEARIEVPYVLDLIGKLKLAPDRRAEEITSWPWPLRITTLGGFELLKDGKRAGSGRKVQHKPLLLLKALIACGGEGVPEEKITDLLWPESEGDAAHSAFTTTLQRLRTLTGSEALLLDGRRLSLDQRFCRVDAWAFERMAGRAEVLWQSSREQGGRAGKQVSAEAYRWGEKALELYRGAFLPGDTGQAWTAAYRERLRSKFLRLVLRQGLSLEEAAEWRKAAETFEQGLDTDELAEEFYQHLMFCYERLGRKTDAVRIYDACRTALLSAFGISPSKKTEALYLSLLK